MTQTASERDAQRAYWKEHSGEATVEAMMLDSKAADIDKLERPEARRAQLIAGDCCGHPIFGHVGLQGWLYPLLMQSDLDMQVLKLLGPVEGLRLVELGAGIGRCAAAAAAKSVACALVGICCSSSRPAGQWVVQLAGSDHASVAA